MENQDQSIKVRKSQLFEAGDKGVEPPTTRPVTEYLKDTPATPLSGLEKAGLWTAAVVVGLLLLAALFNGRNKPRPRQLRPRGVQAVPGQSGGQTISGLTSSEPRRRTGGSAADRSAPTYTLARQF